MGQGQGKSRRGQEQEVREGTGGTRQGKGIGVQGGPREGW